MKRRSKIDLIIDLERSASFGGETRSTGLVEEDCTVDEVAEGKDIVGQLFDLKPFAPQLPGKIPSRYRLACAGQTNNEDHRCLLSKGSMKLNSFCCLGIQSIYCL